MIRRRGYGFYKPPQYVTGHENTAPSVHEGQGSRDHAGQGSRGHGQWRSGDQASLGDRAPLVPETPIDIVPRPTLPPPASAAAEPVAPTHQPFAGPVAAAQPASGFVAKPDCDQQMTAAETKAADQQLEDATKSLKRIMKEMDALDLDEPDASDAGSPEPARQQCGGLPPTSKSAPRTLRRVDRAANKNLSPRQRHSRNCSVCCHPDRDAIEEEFIHWHNPNDTRYDYQISRAALYRHAHAVGLFARRERNLRFALGHMIQRALNITPTSDSILRAIRAYSCLNRNGQWTEPPAHVVVSSGSAARTGLPVSTASGAWEISRALPPPLNVLPAAARPARRAKKSRRKISVSKTRGKSRHSTRNTLTDRKRLK